MFVTLEKTSMGTKYECMVPAFDFEAGDIIDCSAEDLETAREICGRFYSLSHDMAIDYIESIDKTLTDSELKAMRITMVNKTIAIDQGFLGDDWEDDRPQESVDKYNEWKKGLPEITRG